MCRSIAEAGDSTRRRCPIHRRDAVVAIHLAATESGLPQNVVEDLFTELRREGRHVDASGLGGDNYDAFVESIRDQFTDDTPQRYRDIFVERNTDLSPSAETLFALNRIRGAALSRAASTRSVLSDRRRRSPRRSQSQIEAEYQELRREVASEGTVPETYTPEAVVAALEADLPNDVASVVALQRLEERIEEENSEGAGPSRFEVSADAEVAEMGEGVHASYDANGGVLEINLTHTTVRYQNVPADVWAVLRDTRDFNYYSENIRGNSDYQYDNSRDAEDAVSTVRCEGCGQFAPLDNSHVCPAHRIDAVAEVEAPLPTADEIRAAWGEVAENCEDRITHPSGEEIRVRRFDSPPALLLDAGEQPVGRGEFEVLEIPQEDGYKICALSLASWNRNVPDSMKVSVEGSEYAHEVIVRLKGQHSEREFSVMPEDIASYLVEEDIILLSNNMFTSRKYNDKLIIYRHSAGPAPTLHPEVGDLTWKMQMKGFRGEGGPIHDPDYIKGLNARQEEQERQSRITLSPTVASSRKVQNPEVYANARIKWIPANVARKISSGEEVGGHMTMEFMPAPSKSGYKTHHSHFIITGFAAFKQDGEGKVVLSSNPRSLRCNCIQYRENYRCEHIAYFAHVGGAEVIQRHYGLTSFGGHTLPATLSRFDSSVRAEAKDSPGPRDKKLRNITFNKSGTVRSGAFKVDREELLRDKETLVDLVMVNHGSWEVPPFNVLTTALKNADSVTFPLEGVITEPNAYDSTSITGTMTLESDANGSIIAKTDRLRCSCGRFRSSNGCSHIETLKRRAPEMMLDKNFATSTSWGNRTVVETLEEYDIKRAYSIEFRARALVQSNPNLSIEYAREIATERDNSNGAETIREANRRNGRLRREEDEYELERYRTTMPERFQEHAQYREIMKDRWDSIEPSAFDSVSALKARMKEHAQAGIASLPVKESGVTFGICDPNVPGSRRFGIELEFDLPSTNKSYNISQIGQELYRAGLTSSPAQLSYGSARRAGYTKWSFETDATVDAELVSPILDDSPESWEQVRKAVEIIKAHGGKASVRAGSHVHVSSSSYLGSTVKNAELLRLTREHEAAIYRAAADPKRKKHRGMKWCRTNPSTPGYELDHRDQGSPIGNHNSHANGVNIAGGLKASDTSNVEMRMWDSTLDLAVIQQQVAMSVAIVDRAEYNVERDGKSTPRRALENNSAGKFTKATEGHEAIHDFLHEIIPTQEGRDNALKVISINNWVS